MNAFSYPAMPMYTRDHATYCAQMYDWHMRMAQHQDQKRAFHVENAKQFQQFIRAEAAAKNDGEERTKDGAA